MCIRRDVIELDKPGFLERVQGGVLLLQHKCGGEKLLVFKRSIEKVEIRKRIGEAIAVLINDGEKILLGSGSTTVTHRGSTSQPGLNRSQHVRHLPRNAYQARNSVAAISYGENTGTLEGLRRVTLSKYF